MSQENAMFAGVKTEAEPNDLNIGDFLRLLLKRKKFVIGVPLIAAIAAALISLALPDVYKAGTKLLPPQQAQSGAAALLSQLGGVAGAAAGVAGIKNPNELYVGMLRSRTVADKLIATYDLKAVYDTKSLEKARRILEENTAVFTGKDGLITIEVEDENRTRVARLANSYADELLKLTRVLALTEASQRRVFFERQLEQAKDNLAKAETALKGALDTGGVISVDTETRAVVETVARIRAQISAKESQLSSMRAFVTENNPEYKKVEEELKGLRLEQSRLENGRGGEAKSGRSGGLESIKILRDIKYFQMLYELLAKQYEVARLDEAKESSIIQVLDPAVEPEKKFKPKRALIVLITFALGLLGTLGWIYMSTVWMRYGRRVV
jgi:uncharacterized protein involved in exopolysaccharide biosynthesis